MWGLTLHTHQETGEKKVFIDINDRFRSHVHCIISKDKAIKNGSIMVSTDKKMQENDNPDANIYVSQLRHIIDILL
jgi:hypothetical protein